MATKIKQLGSLTNQQWPGKISLGGLIDKKKLTEDQIEKIVSRIDRYYVPTHKKAPLRCIDGRKDPELEPTKLGPQVPGGIGGDSLAYRLTACPDLESGDFIDDSIEMIKLTKELDYKAGGHCDDHCDKRTNTGCGAVDKMDQVIKTLISADMVIDHYLLVQKLMGDSFKQSTYLKILGSATLLNSRLSSYLSRRPEILNYLQKNASESVNTVTGEHQECLLVINTVSGTTFNPNSFIDENNGIQAFNYDIWWTLEFAEAIMPGSDNATKRAEFIHARIMTAVATAMVLTDGSQRLIVRSS